MSLIKNIVKFFSPKDFKNDPYGWLTNQLGHIAGSAWITYVIFLLLHQFTSIPEETSRYLAMGVIGGFWLFWEIRHLIVAGNWQDFLEDLAFEFTGVFIVYNFILFGIILSPLIILSLLWLKYGDILKNPPE